MWCGRFDMVNDFTDRVTVHATKEDFEKIANRSLKDLFGEPCASSIIFHLGGSKVLQEPKTFESKIESIFGVGADIILNHVLSNVENPRRSRKRRT